MLYYCTIIALRSYVRTLRHYAVRGEATRSVVVYLEGEGTISELNSYNDLKLGWRPGLLPLPVLDSFKATP